MGLSLWIRCVVTLSFCCAPAGAQLPRPKSTLDLARPPLVISTTFDADALDRFKVKGGVTTAPNHVVVGEGASIAKTYSGGSVAEFDVDFQFAEAASDAIQEFRLRLSLYTAPDCVVTWSVTGQNGGRSGRLRIATLSRPLFGSPKEQLIREWMISPDSASGNWRVRLQSGALVIQAKSHDDSRGPIYVGHFDEIVSGLSASRRLQYGTMGPCFESCSIESTIGKTRVHRLSIRTAPRVKLAKEAHKELNAATYHRTDAAVWLMKNEHQYAEPLLVKFHDIFTEVLGLDHPACVYALNDLGLCRIHLGQYEFAEKAFTRALALIDRGFGRDHPAYLATLNNLAAAHSSAGNYARAEQLLLEALPTCAHIEGTKSDGFAAALTNLAGVYNNTGQYVRAEPFLVQARDILRSKHGDASPEHILSMNNLAQVYSTMGEAARAEELFLDAEKKSARLSVRHPAVAAIKNNLAALYYDIGVLPEAKKYLLASVEIQKQVLGEKHPDYGISLNNLAELYADLGEFEKAESTWKEAFAIWEEALGQSHPYHGIGRHNLSVLYKRMGRYGDAIASAEKATAAIREGFGTVHSRYPACLSNLAFLRFSTGDTQTAERLLAEAVDCEDRAMMVTLPWVPSARAAMILKASVGLDPWLSVVRKLPTYPADQVWERVWRSQARLSRALDERRSVAVQSPDAKMLYEELRRVQRQLAQATLSPASNGKIDQRRSRLRQLAEKKESLEQRLATVSRAFREDVSLRTLSAMDVLSALPDGTAIVQFAEVAVSVPHATPGQPPLTERHYDVFVAKPAAGVQTGPTVNWIHLGPAEGIDRSIDDWRTKITSSAAPTETDDTQAPSRALREQVWEKIEPPLQGVRNVLIVPDGQLSVVPWAAIPGSKDGSLLLEEYAISTLAHGRQLYSVLTGQSEPLDDTLLVGGVAYSKPASTDPPNDDSLLASAPPTRGPALVERLDWPFLAGTRDEVRLVGELRRSVTLLGSHASETALVREMPRAGYIHLATHGFFADRKFRSTYGIRDETLFAGPIAGRRERSSLLARNPLILSGIVLAGANRPAQVTELGMPTGDDGILTGEEVVNLDLRRTQLVTLSACESGLGKVRGGGEGVFGLQRAFHLAGARSVVASLWKVDDKATRTLMVEFYKNLWQKKLGRLESLRQAQLTVLAYYEPTEGRLTRGPGGQRPVDEKALASARQRRDGKRLPPFYWAGWTLSGDWR